MQVKDIMAHNVVSASPDETVSSAFAKMKKHSIHQLLVASGQEIYGILELRKLVTRDIDPSVTKIASHVTHAPTIDAGASLESAVALLRRSGLRAIPVMDGHKVAGILSETDLVRNAEKLVKGLNMNAHEIMTQAICVDKNDNMGKVKRIMIDNNFSRMPVVDGNKVVGVIGTLDLIRLLEGKEKLELRGPKLKESGGKQKITSESISAATLVHNAPVVDGMTTVKEIIELLKNNEEVIVTHEGTISVITPKDILELFGTLPEKQLYVQITGMQNESIEFKVKMDQAVNEFVQKMAKIGDIQYIFFHVNKMEKGGKKDLYLIRARFKMPFGFFVAHASGWNPLEVIQETVGKLEREVLKKHGKKEHMTKMRHQKNRYS